jgi:hypothetical protein
LTLSFNKNGTAKSGIEVGRKTSFLGEYDRDLDENPTEPLAFEEQFVLRVPESIAGNLREMVKGKNKGLDGVEFKFLGMSYFLHTCPWVAYYQMREEQPSNLTERLMRPNWSICQISLKAKRLSTPGTCSKSQTYLRWVQNDRRYTRPGLMQ